MFELKMKLLAKIETDIAEGKLSHVTGAKLIRYIMLLEDDEQ